MSQPGWGPSSPNHPLPQEQPPAKSNVVWKLVGALCSLVFVVRVTQTSLAAAILIVAIALAVLTAIGLGLWVSSAPPATRALADWARRWPSFVAIVLPTALIGAAIGAIAPKQDADAPVATVKLRVDRAPPSVTSRSSEVEPSPAVEVPPYDLVQDLDLAPKSGRSILVNVRDPDVTDAQCAALVARLRPRAGREGQVAVRIPLHNDRPENHADIPVSEQIHFFPLCYDNLDGEGVQQGTARQMQRAFDNKPKHGGN